MQPRRLQKPIYAARHTTRRETFEQITGVLFLPGIFAPVSAYSKTSDTIESGEISILISIDREGSIHLSVQGDYLFPKWVPFHWLVTKQGILATVFDDICHLFATIKL